MSLKKFIMVLLILLPNFIFSMFEKFNQLPVEIQKEVASWLNLIDTANFRSSNKQLKALIYENEFKKRKEIADELGSRLHDAACFSKYKETEKIINSGNVNINKKNTYGYSTLMAVSELGYTNIAKLLIDSYLKLYDKELLKKHINIKNIDGLTALSSASAFNNKDIVELLIQTAEKLYQKDSITSFLENRDNRGGTALLLAIHNGNIDIIKILINKGANINIKTSNGSTPLDLAKNEETKKLVTELILQQVNTQIY